MSDQMRLTVRHLGEDYSIITVEGTEFETSLGVGEALIEAGVQFEEGDDTAIPSAYWTRDEVATATAHPETVRKNVENFCDAWDILVSEHHAKNYPNVPSEKHEIQEGKRYYKIVAGGAAKAFIDKENGDIYMSASWSKPAKHVRGNVMDETNGMKAVDVYGVKYLR